MSKTVFRYDERVGSLRSPVRTAQGFLRADGYAARVGIYKYRRADGSFRYELRPPEEVFHPDSLASYDGAPITVGHPRRADGELEDVTADNVRRHEVGTVSGAARRDGDLVATTSLIKDAAAIKRVEGGMRELSPGYRIRYDETPGFAPQYATPDNPTGRYHGVQREIRVNHQALVSAARGGQSIQLRMDDAELVLRGDDVGMPITGTGAQDLDDVMTSVERGHQHMVSGAQSMGSDLYGVPSSVSGTSAMDSGSTSWAVAAGEAISHSHDWIRNPDGSITIGMSDGHTHTVPTVSAAGVGRGDGHFDQTGGRSHRGPMTTTQTGHAPPPDAAEQIRLLTVRADEADRVATEQRSRADSLAADRDGLRAELTTVKERLAATEAKIAAGTSAVETAAVLELRKRADAAERDLANARNEMPVLVRQRAGLVAKATAVLPTLRADSLTDREILTQAIRHLVPKEPMGPEVSDDYLRRRFDALVDDRAAYGASLARASQTLAVRHDSAPATRAPEHQQRADQLPWADQWKAGVGEFATSHSKGH